MTNSLLFIRSALTWSGRIAALGGVDLLADPLSNRLMIASATILAGIAQTILHPPA